MRLEFRKCKRNVKKKVHLNGLYNGEVGLEGSDGIILTDVGGG